jgi:predicted O-linked N-acetylglucosamine transferase (SPINDLY family)
VRLPDTAWCFTPPELSPPVEPPPALAAGHVTFGCFNFLPKITDEMLALWARLLAQVPGSRLLIKNRGCGVESARQRVRAALGDAGIAPERVEFAGRIHSLAEHLAFYHRVDIALDTFPYHGTTTTCEALWMGVPVVTLAGGTHASRVGVSLLTNAGLPDLIAADADSYVRIAAALASDVGRLSALRPKLRGQFAASPLMDAPRFARNVEHAFREMWRTWCAAQNPQPAP